MSKQNRQTRQTRQSKQPSEEEAINSLVVEARVLEGTYNELSARQNLLERALLETRAALDAIAGLTGRPSSEILTQIGGGAMLRSPPPSTDKVLVSIGAGVVIEKPTDEAKALLEARNRDVEKTILSVASQRNEIAQRINSDQQALNALLSQSQQSSEE